MTTLLELKEKMVRFYGKNEVFITPVIKFIISFAIFFVVNHNIGYMKTISQTPVALILALLCCVMPVAVMVFLAGVVVLLDLYALSLEVCLVGLLLFLVIYLLYFRFAPKDGYDVLLVPLCFQLHIPCVMPVGMGLVRGIHAVFSLICGTVLYYFLHGVQQNASVLSDMVDDEETSTSKIVIVLNQLLANREMYLVLAVMVLTFLIVLGIRRMSIEHAWTVANISGILFEMIGLIAGYLLLGISGRTVEVLVGCLIAAAIAFLIQFVFFHLDYSRTERLQFEDDEYYYYVKAVPKMAVSERDKRIKRFGGDEDRDRLNKKRFAEEMDIDEELLR